MELAACEITLALVLAKIKLIARHLKSAFDPKKDVFVLSWRTESVFVFSVSNQLGISNLTSTWGMYSLDTTS